MSSHKTCSEATRFETRCFELIKPLLTHQRFIPTATISRCGANQFYDVLERHGFGFRPVSDMLHDEDGSWARFAGVQLEA